MTREEAILHLTEARKYPVAYTLEEQEAYEMAISALREQDVVRSKWKYFRKQGKAVCMNCSFERGLDDNFGRAVACPNCGAKMDLEEV